MSCQSFFWEHIHQSVASVLYERPTKWWPTPMRSGSKLKPKKPIKNWGNGVLSWLLRVFCHRFSQMEVPHVKKNMCIDSPYQILAENNRMGPHLCFRRSRSEVQALHEEIRRLRVELEVTSSKQRQQESKLEAIFYFILDFLSMPVWFPHETLFLVVVVVVVVVFFFSLLMKCLGLETDSKNDWLQAERLRAAGADLSAEMADKAIEHLGWLPSSPKRWWFGFHRFRTSTNGSDSNCLQFGVAQLAGSQKFVSPLGSLPNCFEKVARQKLVWKQP